MFKFSCSSAILSAALIAGSTLLATAAQAETTIYRGANRVYINGPNRDYYRGPNRVYVDGVNRDYYRGPHRVVYQGPNGTRVIRR